MNQKRLFWQFDDISWIVKQMKSFILKGREIKENEELPERDQKLFDLISESYESIIIYLIEEHNAIKKGTPKNIKGKSQERQVGETVLKLMTEDVNEINLQKFNDKKQINFNIFQENKREKAKKEESQTTPKNPIEIKINRYNRLVDQINRNLAELSNLSKEINTPDTEKNLVKFFGKIGLVEKKVIKKTNKKNSDSTVKKTA